MLRYRQMTARCDSQLTCSSNAGGASYRCFIMYSSNNSNRDKCNNWESFIGVLTASLQRTAPLPVTSSTDFFCIKFKEWNKMSTNWACSTFKSANTNDDLVAATNSNNNNNSLGYVPSFSPSNVEGGLHTFSTIVVTKRCHILIQAASFSDGGFNRRTYR